MHKNLEIWYPTNKNDESVKKSFDILTIHVYEKASGSKVNYEKTKGMYIGFQTWTQFFILSIIDFHISSFCIL
jgi:hypothetical protein